MKIFMHFMSFMVALSVSPCAHALRVRQDNMKVMKDHEACTGFMVFMVWSRRACARD